jgi:hypothetical protein
MFLCLKADPDFETQQVFESIPSESDLFLLGVDDIAVGPDGRTYVLDSRSFRIHVWSADGDYLTSFGKQGQGPGEFDFQNNSNSLEFQGNNLYVFDSATGKVTLLDEDGGYFHAFVLDIGRRLVPLFAVVDPETLLIGNASWGEPGFRRLATYDTNGQMKRNLIQIEDKTWRNTMETGQRHVTLIIYATTLITGYDGIRGEILTGDNATNKVQVIDLNGNPTRELSLDLVRRDMTREIKKNWLEMPWFKQQSFYKLDFPDLLPTYNQIVSFDEGYAFFLQVNTDKVCYGIITDKEGKTLRRFDTVFGDSGGLFGSKGMLFTARADDMGDLTIFRVSAGKP